MRVFFLLLLVGCGAAAQPLFEPDGGMIRDAETIAPDAEPIAPDAAEVAPDAAELPPDAAELGPARYTPGRDHSPLTPSVVDHLHALRSENSGDARVFAKVGDSITEATSFLRCFGGTRFDLATHDLESTRAHFAAGDAAGTDPYRRASLAAVVGWSAWAPLRGDPTPLDQELDAIHPAFALVMFGTNDIDTMNLVFYGENMLALIDALLAKNVIPIVSSIPPRDDSASAGADVPRYSLLARAIAEARQVPFIDLEARLRALTDHGLGPDGVHPNADARGACVLDDPGLEHGYNLRNLLSLEALDRVKRTLLDGEPAPDPDASPRTGRGTADDPLLIDTLPFTDVRNTMSAGESAIDHYDCAPQDESGPELHYAFHLAAPARIRAVVIDGPGVDIDLHHLIGGSCDARNDRQLDLSLEAGDHEFVLDTYAGAANAGEFILAVWTE